jgi:poly-D-alanine transfer protein DltD
MQSNFLQALQMAEKSRQERLQKIANLLAELPDDFDWSELEDQLKQN